MVSEKPKKQRAGDSGFVASLVFYILAFPVGLALFVAAFATNLLSADEVLFYRGLKLLVLAAVVQFGVTLLLRWGLNRRRARPAITIHHQIAAIALAVAVNLSFLVVVPVTLDRSVSVFLLGVMNAHSDETFTAQRLETVFDDVYVRKYGAMQRRIDEQVVTGNIAASGDGFKITPAGQRFIQVSTWIANLFHLNTRFVAPDLASSRGG
ncbi:heme/copper-type cytochrome/quinol oxidase subunit 4 [Rhodoblastus acidophilus]|uniref:hypothetical protein n=1 Tax=Rhodoblastus acidophilus TaxID=1074 RepID=UPI0022248541|nr:hypothetical protein [Rhodoblastus acidophilus]MCW2284706.1 heme/copper-type cytochrome/quinol oxidase subunit 4 [Rhodoblastus acidophilus]MCW2333659.1 heme/copper-type cytochrome/quinol oxidase subunit 4 [Rhodoblastus acidophilus]